ncbi:MAG: orotidine-5'-phosphate decarboxylase [Propionibacteriaceae bacterium]
MNQSRPAFGARLAAAIRDRGALCVGIDPHLSVLSRWRLAPTPAGLEFCARRMVEALGDQVAVFKPQSAFFEAFGSAGIAVLERVLADIVGTGAAALLDVKRGDIGSTMAAYAQAYLADGSPLAADAITVNPYLGMSALEPAFELAEQNGRGLFVLALTSNADGGQFQRARSDGRSVAQSVVDEVATRNRDRTGALGSYGVVIGATHDALDLDLADLNGPILAPGLDAQGGTAQTLAHAFGSATALVLPSTSRGVMAAGPDIAALRAAAQRQLAELAGLATAF